MITPSLEPVPGVSAPRVLVTGGGSGIGEAIVAQLDASGFIVDYTYHTSGGGDAAKTAGGGHRWQCDLGDAAALAALTAELEARRLSYFGFVHNAGVSYDALVAMLSMERARALMDINFWSFVTIAKTVIPAMARRRNGRLVAIGSVAATRGRRGNAIYSASKAALDGFMRSLAAELGPRGITANVIAPGYVTSAMTERHIEHDTELVGRIPIGRPGTAAEVAACVDFLLRSSSSFITGSVLTADGGLASSL